MFAGFDWAISKTRVICDTRSKKNAHNSVSSIETLSTLSELCTLLYKLLTMA